MGIFKDIIDFIFGAALFFNALLFVPQAIRIIRNKTAEGVSLITFSGFLIIQFTIILHAITISDYLLMFGYIFSFLTCSSVTVLAIIYRKKSKCLTEKTKSEQELLQAKVQVEDAPRILLVEDNSLIQNVTQVLLNGLGFSVDVAATGAEAIEKFSPGRYGLIYMNIGLPDQDGYSVTQAIREKEVELNALAVPIIALTAHSAVDVETFCGRAGMQGILSKPLTREQAEAVWRKFGLGKSERVTGLTLAEHSETPLLSSQIIDMDGTVALLGTKEDAEELLALWFEMLTKRFLPALKDLIEARDDEALRQELHTMLGSLCYVKTPLLNQAVLELQTAARNHPHSIEGAYQHVLIEAQRFMKYYLATTLAK